MDNRDWLDITAPTVDEAIILAVTRLGITRDEAKIEVLDEGSRGFLGLGSREAHVRVRPLSPQELAEARAETTVEEELPARESPAEPPVRETPAETAEETPEEELPAQESPAEPPAVEAPEPQPVAEPEGRPAPTEPGLDRERVAAIAREVGGRLLKELDVNVKTVWYEDERRPTLWVDIRGKDADSLVGHRARTLHSVQYLFRALVHPQVEDGDFNLVVDADGYRKRRRRSLRNLARKMADKVADSGQSLRLRPMPANERRIIHITLRKDGRVSTRSTGSGRKRAVTIYPEK